MSAVKIGVLKNQLSQYLNRVRRGDRVQIYDRDELIAEIIPASGKGAPSVWERMIQDGFLQPAEEEGGFSGLRIATASPRLKQVLDQALDETRDEN